MVWVKKVCITFTVTENAGKKNFELKKFMLIGHNISLIRPSKYLFILNWKVITWSMNKKKSSMDGHPSKH